MLRTIPSSIDFRAFRDSDIDKDAPLGFKSLVDQILDFAEGLDTVPAQLKVSFELACIRQLMSLLVNNNAFA